MGVVRKKQSRPVEPATEFADRVAPTKSIRTYVSSSRSLYGVQTVEIGLACRRLEDVGSAASEGFARSGGALPIDNRDGHPVGLVGAKRPILAGLNRGINAGTSFYGAQLPALEGAVSGSECSDGVPDGGFGRLLQAMRQVRSRGDGVLFVSQPALSEVSGSSSSGMASGP